MSAPRDAASVLIVAAALTPLWLLSLPYFALHPTLGFMFISCALSLLAALRLLWLAASPVLDVLRQRRLQWRLRRQLHKLLRMHGIEPRDHSDARRKIERDFWHRQQHSALVALRQRFPDEPPRLALYDATVTQLRASVPALKNASLLCVLFTASVAAYNAVMGSGFGVTRVFGVSIIFALVASVVFMTGLDGLRMRRTTAAARKEFVRESHRIATMVELAGGLSLAEDAPDEALRGALSDDVAQPGALSEVEP